MHDRLQEQIEELARSDGRYPPDAYLLVFEGLECALTRLATRRHVTPVELVEGVRQAALDQWGLLAQVVLESWNVRTSGHIGDLVFNLIAQGLLEAGEDDRRDQFDGVFDFETSFRSAFLESLERDPPRLAFRGA